MPFVIEWIKYLVLQTRKKPAGGKERGLDFPLYFLHSSSSVTVSATEEDYTFHVKKELEIWVLLLPSGNSAKAESQRSVVMIVKEEFQDSGKWSKSIISFQWYYWGEAKFPDYSHKRKISNTQWKQRYVQRSMSREKKISQSKTRIK